MSVSEMPLGGDGPQVGPDRNPEENPFPELLQEERRGKGNVIWPNVEAF